jgi:polyisoprenoid-binding protein YceI
MSSSFRAFVFVLAATALTSEPVAARSGSGTLELNPSKTLIEFRLAGALHTTHGQFKLERGTLSADLATGEAKGAIIVDAKSGDSGIDARDNRMKDSVLEVQKYPEIIFVPRHVTGHLEKDDQFRARLQGILKLHGADHPIVMDVQGHLVGDSLIAKSHFSVPYVEWGMRDPSVLFLTVAKQVDIDIATAGSIVWKR